MGSQTLGLDRLLRTGATPVLDYYVRGGCKLLEIGLFCVPAQTVVSDIQVEAHGLVVVDQAEVAEPVLQLIISEGCHGRLCQQDCRAA